MAKKKSVYKNVLVDDKKLKRAEDIAELLTREARTDEEITLKEKFVRLVAESKVKDSDVVEFIYTKLGGLVRTVAEQEAAEAKEKEARQKFNKDKKQDDDEA